MMSIFRCLLAFCMFLFFNVSIYSYKFPLAPLSLCPRSFGVLLSFSIISTYFLISSLTSSLIHWLFKSVLFKKKSVLFSIHSFVYFPVFFTLVISSFILWWEMMLCMMCLIIYWDLTCGLIYRFWAPKSLQMVTAAMKLKDTYSLEGKLWPT